jgi:hypothetical protein
VLPKFSNFLPLIFALKLVPDGFVTLISSARVSFPQFCLLVQPFSDN